MRKVHLGLVTAAALALGATTASAGVPSRAAVMGTADRVESSAAHGQQIIIQVARPPWADRSGRHQNLKRQIRQFLRGLISPF